MSVSVFTAALPVSAVVTVLSAVFAADCPQPANEQIRTAVIIIARVFFNIVKTSLESFCCLNFKYFYTVFLFFCMSVL